MSRLVPFHVVDGPADGPTILLGPSLGTNVHMWWPQVEVLSRRARVVRFDHRGQGSSPVPPGPYTVDELGRDVLALLDHLGAARVHYVGLSLGGMVGMWLAAHAPDRVDRLALLCTAAYLPPAQGWLDRADAVRAGGMAAVADAVLGRWFTPDFRDTARYRAMLLASPVDGYAACCVAIAAMDLRPVLGSIQAPTLVIAGAQDEATPAAFGEQITASVPGARLALVPGAAHLASVERADLVTGLLADHLLSPTAAGNPEDGLVTIHDTGMTVRRQVLGDEHVDRAIARTDSFTEDFQRLITRYAWGEIWTRDGLDRRTRSCITLAMLATLGHHEELAMHVRAALRNGLTPEEIKEVLLQVAIYAGVPAANAAFAVAQRTLREDEPR
jgi:3-oxoadipate enol-lactonase/4-carboxymuconolactone decarboxylase